MQVLDSVVRPLLNSYSQSHLDMQIDRSYAIDMAKQVHAEKISRKAAIDGLTVQFRDFTKTDGLMNSLQYLTSCVIKNFQYTLPLKQGK